MQDFREVSFDGFITYWTLSEFLEADRLKAALDNISLGHCAPKAMSHYTTLRMALGDVIIDPLLLLRPMAKQSGWCILEETRGDKTNSYKVRATVHVNESNGLLSFDGIDDALKERIYVQYSQYVGHVHTMNIAQSLVRIQDSLSGTSLRPQGGMYWLPACAADTWQKVADIFSGPNKSNTVYVIRHKFDADSIRAVHSAIEANLLTEAADIFEEITSGKEPTEKAKASREERIAAMRKKIAVVAAATGSQVATVKMALDKLERAEATSVLVD